MQQTPPNPLDDYQSYSSHHYLIISNNTETLRQLDDQTRSNNQGRPHLADTPPGDIIPGTGGDAIMLINPLINTDFRISSLSLESTLIQFNDSTASSQCSATITEYSSYQLLNVWRSAYQRLGVTAAGAFFAIKTFFVGHSGSGNDNILSNIPLLVLNLKDFRSNFGPSGGTHSVQFGTSFGSSALFDPQLGVFEFSPTVVAKDGRLSSAIVSLEEKVNSRLRQQWQAAKEKGLDKRRLQYQFNIPKEWENFKLESHHHDNFREAAPNQGANNRSEQTTEEKQGVGPVTIAFKPKSTFLAALDQIFRICPQILARASQNGQAGKDGLFRLHRVTSRTTADKEVMTVHVDVLEYYAVVSEKLNGFDPDNVGAVGLDYTFTGQNTAITDLTIQIDDSQVFLDQSANIGARPFDQQSKHTESDRPVRNRPTTQVESATNQAKLDPQFPAQLPASLENTLTNNNSTLSDRVSYYQIQDHALATKAINCSLQMRGFPGLFTQHIPVLRPHKMGAYKQTYERQQKNAETMANGLLNGRSGVKRDALGQDEFHPGGALSEQLPLFIKLNLFLPDGDSNDASGRSPFFYQGAYQVKSIITSFEGNNFTQQLTLGAVQDPDKPV